MDAAAKTANQPQAATEMKVMNVAEANQSPSQQGHCEHNHQKASRLRGGGAAKSVVRAVAIALAISSAALARCAARRIL
ncbi:hypothetical protein M413DRAFT_28003 [Hebeloma cylindrosporum]|uniref:Uncharacterized protein n=1 Tax=Hebeloma cylindrosporum TaxID=76867 RepID=A0A0C2XT75_HEBCY|nr:hypothetical protein M413DRAFT_28003 [Hebeloma cylindrosporum h7]